MPNISIVMPIHNQAEILPQILSALYANISDWVKECIYVLDGCTDDSEAILLGALVKNIDRDIDNKIIYADDVNEVISCNLGYKLATGDYVLDIQSDALIQEKDFDKRLFKPFEYVPNLLGVTGRNSQNERIVGGKLQWSNMAGRDAHTDRSLFAIRDVIVRTPILWKHDILEEMGYLDEAFAPLDSDDKDLSFRAYRKGYLVGSYQIDYRSDLNWGSTRKNPISYARWEESAMKNEKLLIERHKDLIMAKKHDQDIYIY